MTLYDSGYILSAHVLVMMMMMTVITIMMISHPHVSQSMRSVVVPPSSLSLLPPMS